MCNRVKFLTTHTGVDDDMGAPAHGDEPPKTPVTEEILVDTVQQSKIDKSVDEDFDKAIPLQAVNTLLYIDK